MWALMLVSNSRIDCPYFPRQPKCDCNILNIIFTGSVRERVERPQYGILYTRRGCLLPNKKFSNSIVQCEGAVTLSPKDHLRS